MILALALHVLQERQPLTWVELPLPPAALAPPATSLPPALAPGAHLAVGKHRTNPLRPGGSGSEARLGLAELTGLLEEQARQSGAPLTVIYGAPPLLVGGSPEALELARATCRALTLASSRQIELEAWLEPGAGSAGAPAASQVEASGPALLPAGSPRPTGLPWRAAAVPGRTVFLGEREEQEFLATYDVEVASSSSVADPVPGLASTGSSLHLKAWPLEEGAAIFIEGLLDLSQLVGLEEFHPASGDLGLMQLPRVASVQVRFAGRIENGGALRISLRGAPLAPTDWTLHLAAQLTPTEPEGQAWTATDLGFLAARPDESALFPPPGLGGSRSVPQRGASLLQPLEPTGLWARVAPQSSRGGRSLARTVGEFAVLPGDDEASRGRLRALMAVAESARARTALLTVQLGELRVGLPVAAGRPAGVTSGTESLRLADYAVEIAQETWIAAPELTYDFDGLTLGGVLSEAGFRYTWQRAEQKALQRLEPLETGHGRLDLARRVRSAGSGTVGSGATGSGATRSDTAAAAKAPTRAPGEPRLELSAAHP